MTDERLDRVDALVAEKVLKWEIFPEELHYHPDDSAPIYVGDYRPTRDDAQAARVRRQMHYKGHCVQIERYFDVARPYAKDGHVCRCRFPTMRGVPEGLADTEAIATCIAALRAVGVKDAEWS